MISRMKKQVWLGSVLLIATALLGSCAEERDPIDRVQPYALDKSYFVGEDLIDNRDDPEFWARNHVIDVGYGASQGYLFTSTIGQEVARVKWQITESYLIARANYEKITGSDGKGAGEVDKYGNAVGAETSDGIIVAMFPIRNHFDIVKSYNPTTGEELNVIEENSYDRPWYERQYMRVDWSQNLNTDSYDFDTLSLAGIYGGTIYEPVSLFVDNPYDEQAPHFDLNNGYFDITTKAFAKPQTIDLSAMGWGINEFPACFLPNDYFGGSAPIGSCSPVELTLRHSFRRVVDSDFAPREVDGPHATTYGGFYTERHGYNRNYGVTDDRWHKLLNHYNIWERSHYYTDPEHLNGWIPCNTPETTPFGGDPNRDNDLDATADECQEVTNRVKLGGSQCDTFRQRCTLPFRARTPKPMPWYYVGDPNYFEGSDLATHEWDVALRTAVQSAKYAECNRVGDEESCATKYPMYRGQMVDQQDAILLALEVDDCRNGRAYTNLNGRENPEACEAVADTKGATLGPAGAGVSDEVKAIAKMPEMLSMCHSPVMADDPVVCGQARLPEGVAADDCVAARNIREGIDEVPEGLTTTIANAGLSDVGGLVQACDAALWVRAGDLRYHVINGIVTPQTPSPWGIMVSAIDPTTGETIATSSNVWTYVNDFYGQLLVDEARLIKGELTIADITNATQVKDWGKAAEAASRSGLFRQMSREQAAERVSTFLTGKADPKFLDAKPTVTPEIQAAVEFFNGVLPGIQADAEAPYTNAAIYEARRTAARGTEFEAELMTKAVQQQFGVDGLAMSGTVLDAASPLRGGNPSISRDFNLMLQNNLHKRNMCIREFDPSAQAPLDLAILADVLEAKFGAFNRNDSLDVQQARAERIRKYLAQKMHYSVVAHEMGHSIALFHNFVSSSDPWSYRPQYWQLRTKDGQIGADDSTICATYDPTGENCVGPRWYDPVTPNERNNMINMWSQSSIMDYAGEITQDFLGIGIYDFAATRSFYGDTISVYDNDWREGTPQASGITEKQSNSFGGILGISMPYGSGMNNTIHYSSMQSKFGMIQNCKPVDESAWKPARYDEATMGTYHPVLDGNIVAPDGVTYTRCEQQPVDFVFWKELRPPKDIPTQYRAWGIFDKQGRPLTPYGFGGDRWADIGNASVYRHDNGADIYEIFNFLITQKEVSHILDNYRRGRSSFSVRSAAARGLERFNAKVRDGAKGLGLYRNLAESYAINNAQNPDAFWPTLASQYGYAMIANIIASGQVFDHFARELARPEAGGHGEFHSGSVFRSVNDWGIQIPPGTQFNVPTGATGMWGDITSGGELLENTLADGLGEFDAEYTMNCGSYYDKMYVSMLLTESVDNFISADRMDFYDPRYRSVSIADLFPDGYRRMLSNALTGDDEIKGPRVAVDEEGRALKTDDGFIAYPIAWPSWWGETPMHCVPAQGTTVCRDFIGGGGYEDPTAEIPENWRAIDPQIGWEQQKFLIAWTMLYLPENEKQKWFNMLRIWEIGKDADPSFANRIELHHPDGRVYVAQTFGQEELFGKQVEIGIAARVLQYANELMAQAYETTTVQHGATIWYLPVMNEETGQPIVRFPGAGADVANSSTCNETDNSGCVCNDNPTCITLGNYVSIPMFMRQALDAYAMADPEPAGILD